jgi:uncharacterized damage-inducible protein DinB
MREANVLSLPVYAREYLIDALAGTPVILDSLLQRVPDETMDARPDPDRFTLREVAAHLADWEPIWHERITRMRKEDMPFLHNVDESELALENRYSESDIDESLKRFRTGRSRLIDLLRQIGDQEWDRRGNRERAGIMTIYQLAVLVLCHDGYHLKQVASAA